MTTHLKWFLVAGMVGLLGLGAGAYAIFSGGSDPEGYVRSRYDRARDLDEGRGEAYTSNAAPSSVADDITDEWEPARSVADGSGIYLRYSDDVIAIFPRDDGSLILIDDADRAYRTYYGHVGGYWGWGSGVGGSFRGGGPGSGK